MDAQGDGVSRRTLAALPLALGVPYALGLLVFAHRYAIFVGQLFLVLCAHTRVVPLRQARYAVVSDGHVVHMHKGHVVL